MPVQKGKRRKRPRGGRLGSDARPFDEEVPKAPIASQASGSRAARRKRFELPLWANLTAGVFLLILGTLFTLTPQKGFSALEHGIILLGYVALSALYLSKAFRQYRARQNP